VLVERRGILVLDRDGALVAERNVGVDGLADLPYRDLAATADGRIVLIADNEGYLWTPETAQLRLHFCVEPGFIECTDENGILIDANVNGVCDWDECVGEDGQLIDQNADAVCDWQQCMGVDGTVTAPDENGLCGGGQPAPEPTPEPTPEPGPEPTVVQQNDALALLGDLIVAAPRFYDDGAQVEAAIRTYDLASGRPIGGVDLTGRALELMGLSAFEGGLLGVAADRLVRFDGQGNVVAETALEGVEPAGLVVDGADVLVLDRSTLRIVAVPAE
jgi:hypothetical protein